MNENKKKRQMKQSGFYVILVSLFLIAGCASAFMKGGSLAPRGYRADVLIDYKAEGTVPAGVTYHLVKTKKGEAMFERSSDGSGALFETRWRDSAGDHFAGWVATSHGYEYVVPLDRSKPAKKYVYPAGYYNLKTINGVTRPVPVTRMDPVATLFPR